jgi:uracil-DNA glycosylase
MNCGFGRLTPYTAHVLIECGALTVIESLPVGHIPTDDLVFEAFRLCPIENAKVALLGQDPYPNGAHGLSFSSLLAKTPASLVNIKKSLDRCGFPLGPSNDLTHWALQGVLCLNTALTLDASRAAGSHLDQWKEFTKKIMAKLAAMPDVVFILLGAKAQVFEVPGRSYKWCHPSPQVQANQQESNPANFMYCDIWKKIDFINWGRPETCLSLRDDDVCLETVDVMWVVTDGGATDNGAPSCRASWAFHITNGIDYYEDSGEVCPIDIPGEKFRASNNRGEYLAILRALEVCAYESRNEIFPHTVRIVILTDSKLAINILSGTYKASANLDLVTPTRTLLAELRSRFIVEFEHIHSHPTKKEIPSQDDDLAWFKYTHNDRVDKMCAAVLSRKA